MPKVKRHVEAAKNQQNLQNNEKQKDKLAKFFQKSKEDQMFSKTGYVSNENSSSRMGNGLSKTIGGV